MFHFTIMILNSFFKRQMSFQNALFFSYKKNVLYCLCSSFPAQLSVQEAKGDQSNHNDENKLLGDRYSVSSALASVSQYNFIFLLLFAQRS